MMKRKALGKGLGSLIPEIPAAVAPEVLRYLDPESMTPNRFQPRETFDEADLRSLTESIRRDGLLQPVVARPAAGGGYEIIAGERRWRAARTAGLKRIPVMIQEIADDRALELALVENLQRRDLDPLEEAKAFRVLSERFDLTQDQIAERVGKSRSAVANTLRILKLPAEVQDLIRSGKLTRGHARALLALDDEAQIRSLAARLVDEQMNVRTAEAETRTASGRKRPARERPSQDPNVRAAEERLQSRLGTKVTIDVGAGGRGKIEIQFASDEELSRLFDGLMTARF
ncbi:MAG: ParB/RepB/Spo0J family partition protein [Acidobacteria bacterium]|nr:ParB/RepB/Spo0J family partition protein [Acidobacteriota bacterium]